MFARVTSAASALSRRKVIHSLPRQPTWLSPIEAVLFGLSQRWAFWTQRSLLFSDYLREQAEKYRKLAEATEDFAAKKEFLELAAVCEKVANEEDDRQTDA